MYWCVASKLASAPIGAWQCAPVIAPTSIMYYLLSWTSTFRWTLPSTLQKHCQVRCTMHFALHIALDCVLHSPVCTAYQRKVHCKVHNTAVHHNIGHVCVEMNWHVVLMIGSEDSSANTLEQRNSSGSIVIRIIIISISMVTKWMNNVHWTWSYYALTGIAEQPFMNKIFLSDRTNKNAVTSILYNIHKDYSPYAYNQLQRRGKQVAEKPHLSRSHANK